MPSRRDFLRSTSVLAFTAPALAQARIPPRTVVLTFDDAVKSHRTFVAPLLKELDFRASFFVTHLWMSDTENFMTWKEIAEIHEMGFEIGNHAWTHGNYSTPRGASLLAGELALTENELRKVKVPRPISFAWCGNGFGPEGLRVLHERGFRFARRGMQPEVEYGKVQAGPTFDPAKNHPLLIPTTGDAYPNWSFEHFERVIAKAEDGQAVVLQFHGVPDNAHSWVHTPPENFRRYMAHLKEKQFRVIALRDLEPFLDLAHPPQDPTAQIRYPVPNDGKLVLPVETEQTRASISTWVSIMQAHKFSREEMSQVTGITPGDLPAPEARRMSPDHLLVLPYPGGRHPRIGFLEGAIDPLRGTKASVFLPWNPDAYVVVDLPEAIFSNLGLLFLAHTHVPTIWNDRNITLENIDWRRLDDGGLNSRWTLPNGVVIGASIEPRQRFVEMALSLENGTKEPLTAMRAQVCVLLKGAPGFNAQTGENKTLNKPFAGVRGGRNQDQWIVTSWENCGRVWENPPVPCIHSDPLLPDCAPGQTVKVRGRLWFAEGKELPRPIEGLDPAGT